MASGQSILDYCLEFDKRDVGRSMIKPATKTLDYHCECGKTFTFTTKDSETSKCSCGRTIVIRHGFAYSRGRV
jgi:hypothetical protein